MGPRLKRWGRRGFRRLFESGQRARVDVLPHDYYSPVPDIAALRGSSAWRAPYSMEAVAGAGPDEQLAFAAEVCRADLVSAAVGVYERACELNHEPAGFGPVEADFLFCFVAARRPARVVQVGCGVATAVMLAAADAAGYELDLTGVDPHPTGFVREAARGGRLELIARPAQESRIDSLATGLGDGDLLFVDSTHAVKPGSEVNRIVLEVLPRLAAGTQVHFHDVLWPYDYSPTILGDDLHFWTESALLHAFLVGNRRYRLCVALSMLHHARPRELAELLPRYRPAAMREGLAEGRRLDGHLPSSAYLRAAAA